MQLCIRAHDLGVKGTQAILARLEALGLDGVQLVCYKSFSDIAYAPGAITAEKAAQIGEAFREAGKSIALVGAYFNPVHSDPEKVERCSRVFADYLKVCRALGCSYVGSETGSFNDEPWIYHPKNRTPQAVEQVARVFGALCDVAAEHGAMVAVEGAAGHVCHDPQTLQRARELIGRPTKVIFDLFNYLDQGNQRDYLQILDRGLDLFRGQILLFHMKDCTFNPDGNPKQVPLGTGQLELEQILARIKACDENAVLTLEGTTGEDIPHAVKTIHEIWERV